MRSLVPVLATAALAASLSAATSSPASAAGETCRGVPATIAASGVIRVEGTDGNDVIVADNVTNAVYGLGGDDLICLTGTTRPMVAAGDGDDVVDASAGAGTSTYLGNGDDTFVGSVGYDQVDADGFTADGTPGHDVIDTGPAGDRPDWVQTGSGGRPNSDQVQGGWIRLEWTGVPTAASSADGGAGSKLWLYTRNDGVSRVRIDARDGALSTSASGARLRFEGFTDFEVRGYPDLERLTFRGTGRDETLVVGQSARARVRAAMGGGDDVVEVAGTYAKGSDVDGGPGRDRLDVDSQARSVTVDLARGTLSTGGGTKAVTRDATAFERATVKARTVRLRGTRGPNALTVKACRGVVEGLGGADRITAAAWSSRGGQGCRGPRHVTLSGGGGNDTLTGSDGPDVLLGGPGRDRADGRKGRDTCQAEVRRSCEVVRR